MRFLALAAASIVATASTAQASDVYPWPPGYKDGPAYVTANWSGAYIGGNAGGARTSDKVTDLDGYGFFSSAMNEKTGVIGGGQLGYNFQRGSAVIGVEGDIGVMDVTRTVTNRLNVNLRDDFYADATGRLGYAFSRGLIYAKGGAAFFEGSADVVNPGRSVTAAKSFVGWTVGGGIEYKLASAWSIKAEYMHFDFGAENSTIEGFRYEHQLTAETVKAGINYFILPGYAPLK
jgi:outer membrane immunogenic protein